MSSVRASNSMPWVDVLQCPLCGSTEKGLLAHEIMTSRPNYYVRRLASFLRLTTTEFAAKMSQYQCPHCHTIFLSPYLTDDVLSDFYISVSPRHRLGWQNFEKQLLGRWSDVQRLSRVTRRLQEKCGPLKRYGEFACPFQGLLLATTPRNVLERQFSRFELERWPYRAGSPYAIIIATYLERARARLVSLLLRISRIFAGENDRTNAFVPVDASQRYVFVEPTTQRWGLACAKYGNCFECASSLLDCKVRFLDEFLQADYEKLDLIACFNSLDHSPAPMETLEKLSKISRAILVTGHAPEDAGYQHRFAFGANTLAFLAPRFGFEFEDISAETWGDSAKMYAALLIDCNHADCK